MAKSTGAPGGTADRALQALTEIKVRATQMGYYDLIRRRVGDVFVVAPAAFSAKWMERVDPNTPEVITTGKEELRRAHNEIVASRMPATGVLPDDGPTGSKNPIKA